MAALFANYEVISCNIELVISAYGNCNGNGSVFLSNVSTAPATLVEGLNKGW